MKVFLSPLAEKKIELLLAYLELEWSKKVKTAFLAKLLKGFDRISKQPWSCAESPEIPNVYKCILTKQTAFYYRIKADEIEIITVIDNRQDPETIRKEIQRYFGLT